VEGKISDMAESFKKQETGQTNQKISCNFMFIRKDIWVDKHKYIGTGGGRNRYIYI
jgi:hypothetical protein